jgi:arylsulfatase A-like enzyme
MARTTRRLAVLCLAMTFLGPTVHAAERPNIIFIMADDLGSADLGCYGQKEIRTPNLDRLAAQGTRFTQVYAGCTVCAPSRSVLQTGQHTGHTRIRSNASKLKGDIGESGEKYRYYLHDEDVTVAEVLKSAGYATGMTGKWGLGEAQSTGQPNRQGYDQWFGYLNQDTAKKYYPPFLWLNKERFDLVGNADGRREQYSHDLLTGFALNFIRAHRDEPFFLYVPYTIPHAAHEVPDLGDYAGKEWPDEARQYAAMVSRMDADVGRIVELVDSLKLSEKTLIFFTSDNGGPAPFDSVFHDNGILRGKKGTMYEGGLRVPMIARWPGHVPAGQTSDVPWYFADFLPTAAELAGASVPGKIDGVSVLPTLLGKKQDLADRFLYWEIHPNFRQAVRWRHWKAVREGSKSPLQLYDLTSDPTESRNVAERNPQVVAEITKFLSTARTESDAYVVDR